VQETSNQKIYHGVLAIDKPVGMTSFDVIRRLKKLLGIKKIGHGGTLDKAASGVLPILIGEATKLFDYLLTGEKEYVATIRFGEFTETDDAEGEVIESFDFQFDEDAVLEVLSQFVGEIDQVPPIYSALKINGKRSYKLARQNQEVKHKPRKVSVYSIVPENFDKEKKEAVLRIRCSSGTYIRSIARDLGRLLGWGAHLSALRRTQSAGVKLGDCCALENLTSENVNSFFIPFNQALSAYPELSLLVSPDAIRQGKKLNFSFFKKSPENFGVYRVTEGEAGRNLLALVNYNEKGLKYLRVFQDI